MLSKREELSDLVLSHTVVGRQGSKKLVYIHCQCSLPLVEECSVVEDPVAALRRMRRRERTPRAATTYELIHHIQVELNELAEAAMDRPCSPTHAQLHLEADEDFLEAAHGRVSVVGPREDAASEEGISESR